MPVSGLHTFTDGEVLTAANLNTNFNALAAKFNAGIVSADAAAAAGFGLAQLAASYQRMDVVIPVWPTLFAGGWPGATTIITARPFHDDGKGNWTATRVTSYCNDYGTGAARYQVRFVTMTAGVVSNAVTIASGLALSANFNDSGAISTALTFAAARNSIIVEGTTADATTMDAATDWTTIVVTLTRPIFA